MGSNSLMRDIGKVKRAFKDNDMSQYIEKLQEYMMVVLIKEKESKE